MTTLVYVHDPMCSWCWGYRPTLERLRRQLPGTIAWQNWLGGLAPDSDQPMPDATKQMVMGHWRRIQAELGTQFNFDFWTRCAPRRSTWPACRAVIAAARQQAEEAMIDAIQNAYYLRALDPSDQPVLLGLADELRLDTGQFASDLANPATHAELQRQVAQARTWGVRSFPSLLLLAGESVMPLPLDYHDESTTLSAIGAVCP